MKCEHCGELVPKKSRRGPLPKRLYCSQACRVALCRTRKPLKYPPGSMGTCRQCGAEFLRVVGTRRREYCSKRCISVAHGPLQGARRRAREVAAVREVVCRDVVLRRDAGRCGICDLPIMEPNWHLDHILPLSKGGEHSYANVQATHARCNLSKHARVA